MIRRNRKPDAGPERPQGLIPGSGRRGSPRKLGCVVSIRMDPEFLFAVQRLASSGDVSVSEWMRRTAEAAVFESEKPAPVPGYHLTGWQCAHMSMTAGPTVEWGKVTAECGCEMQPVYTVARAA